MRWWGVLALASACSFRHGSLAVDTTADDAPADTDVDMAIDTPAAPLCNPADLDLRACYTFDGTTLDGSSYHNDATATGTAYVAGHRGQALQTSGAATVTVASTSSLDVATLTIRMWIKPYTLPVGSARMGLVDSASRYRMFVQAFGALRCAITGGPDLITAQPVITMGVWQRVTCTYDGTTMKLYVDGALVDMLSYTGTIPAVGTGMMIGHNNPTGDNFNGALDDVEVWGSIVGP